MDRIITRGINLLGRLRNTTRLASRKLLFVYPFCGLGGVETATLAKIAALRGVGVEASVLFREFYGDGARAFASQQGVTVGLPDERAVAELVRARYDAVSVIDYPEFVDLLLRYGVETPILFETHCAVPFELERFYLHLEDHRLKAIVVPSQHNEYLIRERVHPTCDIVVLPNGVDDRVFRPGKLGPGSIMPDLPDGEKLVLWVGRLEDDKNPGELIDIAERLLERINGIRFLVVGDLPGSYEGRRKQLLNKMKASTRRSFTFIRTVSYDSMPDLYRLVGQKGGVLISTSLHESLPMIFLEAMACGCPVLSTDVGGVRDIIIDRLTGRLYAAGNLNQAVAILQELLSSENRRSVKRMIRRGHHQIMRHHSLRVVARRYQHLLGQIIGPRAMRN